MQTMFNHEDGSGITIDTLMVEKGYPSQVWWPTPTNCISETIREWQRMAKWWGFSDSIEHVTITVDLDEDHPHRMRTVTVKGKVKRG